MSKGLGGKLNADVANERPSKGPELPFSARLQSIAPPRVSPVRKPRPDTSALAAQNRYEGRPAMDDPRTFVAPGDRRELRQDVGRITHSMFSKEGNLRSTALINGFLSSGHWHSDLANLIHVRNGQVHLSGTREQQIKAAGLLNLSSNKFLASAQELASAGPGLAMIANSGVHHPIGTVENVAKGMGSSMAGTFTHGHYGAKNNTPLDDLLNVWTVATLGAAGAGKAGLLGDINAPRSIEVGGKVIHSPVSRNPAAALLQKHVHDRLLVHGLNSGNLDLGGMATRGLLSREARVARMARRHMSVESALAGAPAHELTAYEKLTPAEKHAAWISLTGHKPADVARAFENGKDFADHLSNQEGVSADLIRQNHDKLLGLTREAGKHLDEHGAPVTPRVAAAVAAIRRAIAQREGLKGMTEEEINHSLGSRWYALHHLSENPTTQSLHQELASLGKLDTPEAVARIEQIHKAFTDKGATIADRASYLPAMNETKALKSRAVSAVTRRPGPYGFTTPQGERTHAFEGKLFNRGDIRTDAVALAQHSFGKARHMDTQQGLHEMLQALSKSTPEEVGHTGYKVLRTGKLTPDLKRAMNKIAESHGDAESEKAIWNHYFGAKEDEAGVRFLHPDIAKVFEPHNVGRVGRNLNRFNSLIRAQRYLNPKYGVWFGQNAAVGLPQQGALMGSNLARYVRVIKKLDPETYSKIESGVGAQGMSKSILTPTDTKLTRHLGSFWHHVNDHVFRMMSFVHEARRRGYSTAEDFRRLMHSEDPKVVADRHDIIRNANDKAINYSLTPAENARIRPALAYYPWTKGASLWTMRLLRDHPLWAQLELEAGRKGKKYLDEFFAKHGGLVPPTMEGDYPAKGGPIDMEFANTPSTFAQDAEALLGIGNQSARKYFNGTFLGQSSPFLKAGLDVATGLTSKGRQSDNPLGQAAHDLTSGGPLPAAKSLFGKPPQGKTSQQEFLHYMGWLQEPGVNYDQEAAIGASIDKNALRGPAQVQADVHEKLRQVDQLAMHMKLPPGYKEGFDRYFTREGERNALLAKYAQENGHHADKYKDAVTSLGYDNPDLYYVGTAEAIAHLANRPEVVAIAQSRVKELMAGAGTDQQKAAALRKLADNWWNLFNPKSISSAYYKLRDRANLR